MGQCTALLDDTTVWRRCAAAAPDTSAGAQALVEILSGRPKTVSAATTTWAELLVAQLLHVHPALGSLPELRQLLHRCVADKAPSDEFQHVLAAALDACCDADAQSALRACSEFASDWFLAHIPEVLAASPAGAAHMSRMLPHLGATQVEFYKLEFASALAPHASTWRLATEYLAWCESYGQQAFRALMHRLPFTGADTALALRAVEGCKDQGLDSLVGMLQRVQGAVCWQEGLVGSAIAWFGLADDLGRADAALQPTVSLIQGGAEAASAEDALLEALDVLPPGSSNHALLRVKALMRGGRGREGGNGSKPELHQAVEVLRQLPGRQRQQCLELVWGALPCVDPSALSEGDVTQLLEWLEGAEGADGENGKAVARLALVRLLAASHLRGNGKTAIV